MPCESRIASLGYISRSNRINPSGPPTFQIRALHASDMVAIMAQKTIAATAFGCPFFLAAIAYSNPMTPNAGQHRKPATPITQDILNSWSPGSGRALGWT